MNKVPLETYFALLSARLDANFACLWRWSDNTILSTHIVYFPRIAVWHIILIHCQNENRVENLGVYANITHGILFTIRKGLLLQDTVSVTSFFLLDATLNIIVECLSLCYLNQILYTLHQICLVEWTKYFMQADDVKHFVISLTAPITVGCLFGTFNSLVGSFWGSDKFSPSGSIEVSFIEIAGQG